MVAFFISTWTGWVRVWQRGAEAGDFKTYAVGGKGSMTYTYQGDRILVWVSKLDAYSNAVLTLEVKINGVSKYSKSTQDQNLYVDTMYPP